jgi:hypothetical protein
VTAAARRDRARRSARRALAALVTIALSLGCAGGAAGTAGGGGSLPRAGVSFRADERVVFPAMTNVRGVAATDRYLFVATPLALGVYDLRFNAWLPPVTGLDGWPRVLVSVMMADPADPSALWFAADNVVYRYRVGFDDITRAVVPDLVSPSAFFAESTNPAAGIVVGGGSGLVRVSPSGFVQPYVPSPLPPRVPAHQRVTPQTVASVYARYPSLQNFERLLTRDAELRSWPVQSATTTPQRSEVWLGTAGGGVFKVDPVFSRGEQVPFGLIGGGATAVVAAGTGVWFGGATIGAERGGLTLADNELRAWRWVDGGLLSPIAGAQVTHLDVWEAAVWVATERGLFRVDGRSGTVIGRWDDLSGLPHPLVYAVAATQSGAWVGTPRGLAFVQGVERAAGTGRTGGVDDSFFRGRPVTALVTRRDTLWMGTDIGVMVLAPGQDQPRRLAGFTTDARHTAPVVALASADSVVAVATDAGEVYRVDTRTGAILDEIPYVPAGRVGRIGALAMDARTLWVAGERGVLVVHRESRVERLLAVGADLPAPALGVALVPGYAWIATRDAGVRLRRLDDGTVR